MNSEIRNIFLEFCGNLLRVARWNFLTNHAQVLLCLARDPGVRLREIAAGLGITERSAHAIVADLAAAGYVVKQKHGRRNRYQIQAHLPLPEPASPKSAIGDVLALLMGGREAEGSDARSLVHARDTATGTAAGTTTESGGISA
jgi:predicted ArsR family transcriptional regulator